MTSKINKSDIVRRLMSDGNLSYSQAQTAYDCFVQILAKAVLEEKKLNLAPVGMLVPHRIKGKTVVMNFKREKGQVTKCIRKFYLDDRSKFVLRVNPSFVRSAES